MTNKIYLSAPQYTEAQLKHGLKLAEEVEKNGLRVFWQPRDAFHLTDAISIDPMKGSYLNSFLSLYQIATTDITIASLDGRVPDEDSVASASIAFTLGKPVILYHSDSRTKINGRISPLLYLQGTIVKNFDELLATLNHTRKQYSRTLRRRKSNTNFNKQLNEAIRLFKNYDPRTTTIKRLIDLI